jgi:hypothetical protein
VDVTLRRFHDLTGIEPVHAESSLTFERLQAVRTPSDQSMPEGSNTGGGEGSRA